MSAKIKNLRIRRSKNNHFSQRRKDAKFACVRYNNVLEQSKKRVEK